MPKLKAGDWVSQAYTGTQALVLEVRPTGKVRVCSYSCTTGRVAVGFLTNWHPEPVVVGVEDVSDITKRKVKAKLEELELFVTDSVFTPHGKRGTGASRGD
jgi:hypothetical protein